MSSLWLNRSWSSTRLPATLGDVVLAGRQGGQHRGALWAGAPHHGAVTAEPQPRQALGVP